MAQRALCLAAVMFIMISSIAGAPSITKLSGDWQYPTAIVSTKANLDGNERDLPTINNFWGAVGIAPQGVRPVDMFAINSLELPPFAGCGMTSGGIDSAAPFGCGRMLVDGQHVQATSTKWSTHEAGRKSAPLAANGVVVESLTRMPFETNGVFWLVKFTNPTKKEANMKVDFELSAMVNRLTTVGTWCVIP